MELYQLYNLLIATPFVHNAGYMKWQEERLDEYESNYV